MSEQIYENIKQENSALRNENAMLKEELALANQQLEWFRKQVFGRKTEQTSVVMDFGVQLSMFEKDKAETVSAAQVVTVPEHKRRKKRTHDEWMNSLIVEVEYHKINDPACEICGSKMNEAGEEKAYDELIYSPARFHIRRHIVKKYKCTVCGEKPEERDEHCHIICASYPKAMIPGS